MCVFPKKGEMYNHWALRLINYKLEHITKFTCGDVLGSEIIKFEKTHTKKKNILVVDPQSSGDP